MILDKQLLVGCSMGKETHHHSFQFNNRVIIYPLLFVLLMWLVFWFELRFSFNFTKYGVLPRELSGLRGILFSPFIHSNLSHLWHNSIPTLILLAGLIYFYRPVALKVFLFLIIFSGLGTWIVGREAYHIGASGIVYGLASFLFFKGLWSKNFRLTAFSLIVVFLYGSLIWGTLPLQDGMSWEGHLSGFLTGAILAFLLRNKIAKAPKYIWETESYNSDNDPFLQQFDENGNFIDPPAPDTEEENFKED
ncbi:rhomboid family intramembrane serine protease [Leeuwenhoekiella aequorea]|uniref:Membrane associated rhomboid family serine protease n=1 Tax=Leeuwenhoekiella aequorea TaxID=283736 RepID=A0A4Q0P908_9FLAO|nr:rhomboid family intramembrane serine protease [Leeuwenhoekiella aequorea]RXG22696.1 membrane associated rhomboid family serine protease [Leeuwenhoekiella aequorea]